MEDKKYTYEQFSPEELQEVVKKLQTFCDEHNMDIRSFPVITDQGAVSAKLMLVKKVELVPKTDTSVSEEA